MDDASVINVIGQWAFSQEVLSHVTEEVEDPGLIILMELYKGSSYELRALISSLIIEHLGSIRFSPELMSWAIECLLVAEFDSREAESEETAESVKIVQSNFYNIISQYEVEEEDENNELSITKLIFSSVKSKYPDNITKVAGNKIFFTICLFKMQSLLQDCSGSGLDDLSHMDSKIISNVVTFITEYFVLKGD